MKRLNSFLLSGLIMFMFLLFDSRGCGDDDEEDPVPTYAQSPRAKELEDILFKKSKKWAETPYEDWLKRYTVPEQPLTREGADRMKGLFGAGYSPTGYEEYLKRFTPTAGTKLGDLATQGYEGLIGKGYGTEDYGKTEQDYLDVILKEYRKTRGEGFEPVREGLIAENLLESGPGFKRMQEYGEATAEGVTDIGTKWAYEGIERKENQKRYMDALERGDYTAAYNMALKEEERELQPRIRATEMANLEKTYYDALERGDITAAMNIGQLLRQNKLYPIERATETEFGAISPASNLFGQITQEDLAAYQAQLEAYKAQPQDQRKSLGGAGASLGMLAGALLAAPTGGTSMLAGAAIGGGVGGGLGGLFDY